MGEEAVLLVPQHKRVPQREAGRSSCGSFKVVVLERVSLYFRAPGDFSPLMEMDFAFGTPRVRAVLVTGLN